VCGATSRRLGDLRDTQGASPRVRGNRPPVRTRVRRQGSIPACAGQPLQRAGKPGLVGSIPACAGQPSRCRAVPAGWTEHPRVCGATELHGPVGRHIRGASPRVRGNLETTVKNGGEMRSIPACAGQPTARSATHKINREHPRVCGATRGLPTYAQVVLGASPRVRGNPYCHRHTGSNGRSIPACAGQPRYRWWSAQASPEHPRVCGATISSTTNS